MKVDLMRSKVTGITIELTREEMENVNIAYQNYLHAGGTVMKKVVQVIKEALLEDRS